MQLQNQSEKINETRQIILEVKVEVDQKIKCLEEKMKTEFSTKLEESQKSLKEDLMLELESITAKNNQEIMELVRVHGQEIQKITELKVFRQQWKVQLHKDA